MARVSINSALLDTEILDILGPIKRKNTSGPADPLAALVSDCLSFFQKYDRLPGLKGSVTEKRLARRLESAVHKSDGRAAFLNVGSEAFQAALYPSAEDHGPISVQDFLATDDAKSLLGSGIFELTNVRPTQTRKSTNIGYVGRRAHCSNFENFRPIFDAVHNDIQSGSQKLFKIAKADQGGDAGVSSTIREGNIFSLDGQLTYVASIERNLNGNREDGRLLLIFENGTQSDVLLASFANSLRLDARARWLRPTSIGPLFSPDIRDSYEAFKKNQADHAPFSGHIYLLRSRSTDPALAPYLDVLHKIGCTKGEVNRRIAGAEKQASYLCAPVETVAEFRLHGLDPFKVEKLLHKFFVDARLDISLKDRWGNQYQPQEWFILPSGCVNEAIEAITAGTLPGYSYDKLGCKIRPR